VADATVFIATTREGKKVRLTRKVWALKLLISRPEFSQRSEYPEEMKAVLEDPDYIVRGDKGELIALRWCDIAPKRPKYLCVIYRELNGKGFIITAFFTSRLQRFLQREIVWQR
jgi:hypothetical protein